mgnify:CR=1 FL=1
MMQKVQDHINNILDVNASWREAYNEIGCLLAFDYDLMLDGSILADVLMEDHGISEEEACYELQDFALLNNYVWPRDLIEREKDYVIKTLTDFGGDGESDYQDYMNREGIYSNS